VTIRELKEEALVALEDRSGIAIPLAEAVRDDAKHSRTGPGLREPGHERVGANGGFIDPA
jgi:hypothetical protein